MAESEALSSVVGQQYEEWVYPLPIADLSAPEARRRRDGGDPGTNYFTFWPDQPYRDDLDILVAGCGSNAGARYAFNHPRSRVVGIDLSSSSLAHEAYLKDKHGLDNLTLRQGRLEEVASLLPGVDFDFIDVSGVLHHLPDPVDGLRALGSVLRPDGTIAIMVYGKYGRTGVYMVQEMFRLMGLGQSEDDVATVKQTLAALPKGHVSQSYFARAHDIRYDAGIVDTFLHPQDRAYTVAECIALSRNAGLKFMGWWDNIFYYPDGQLTGFRDLYQRVNAMPEESIWGFMELYNGTLGQHNFCVCRPERPDSSYTIGFRGRAFMNYVPVRRGQEVTKPGAPEGCVTVQHDRFPAYTLDPVTSDLFRQIDGARTIRGCFERAGLGRGNGHTPEATCREAFQYLWRLGQIFLRLPSR